MWGRSGYKLLTTRACNIPNFQFGMLYIRSSLHSIFYCILAKSSKILSNSRTLGESWGFFPVFIFDFYQIMKRGFLVFNYFSLRKIFHIKINERRKYDFSKIIEILEKNIKIKYLILFAILIALEKLHVFKTAFLGQENVHLVLIILIRR